MKSYKMETFHKPTAINRSSAPTRAKLEAGAGNDPGKGFFLSKLAESATVVEFKESILSVVRQLGFTDFTFSVLHGPAAKNMSTLPEAVREFYLKDNFASCDFFLEHAENSSAPLFLSALAQHIAHSPFSSERVSRNAAHFELLASCGYHDCYSIPHSFGGNTRRAVISLFAKDIDRESFRDRVEQCQPLLPMLVEAIIFFGFTLFPEHFLDATYKGDVDITPKPLKILEVCAKEGLILKEAAARLCISLDTANKHVAAAKQALGATTLANAVYLAMVHGLISGDSEPAAGKPAGCERYENQEQPLVTAESCLGEGNALQKSLPEREPESTITKPPVT